MKLAERKLTTKQGLEELRTFLKSFDFQSDIKRIITEKKFFARVDINDSYKDSYMMNCDCSFKIENGELLIVAIPRDDENCDYCYDLEIDQYIKRIEFLNCIESFFDVVEKYNNAVVKKEEEIENLMKFVAEYKMTK
jgi:hypothetical protein